MRDGQIQYQPRKGVDARFRNTFIEVKAGVDATRTLRGSLFRLAEIVAEESGTSGILLLTESIVTKERLGLEWEAAKKVIRGEILDHLSICLVGRNGEVQGVPQEPKEAMRRVLLEVARHETGEPIGRGIKVDFGFIIRKLLLHNFFAGGKAMSVGEIAAEAGCSFPTAAEIVKSLGSLIERTTDRRVALKYFPRDKFDEFAAGSKRARMAVRFSDASGQPRTPESMVRRLAKMGHGGIAIGGVLGARHYLKSLDLVGTPRLDLSVHVAQGRMNLDFVKELDPALKIESDPQRHAALVVHAVRHTDSMFVRRADGLMWADEIECLLDLREAGLQAQAGEFFDWLEQRRGKREYGG